MLTNKNNLNDMEDNYQVHHEVQPLQISSAMKSCFKDCLCSAFCTQCVHWMSVRHKMISSGLFDVDFFERREFRSDRTHRAICFFCSNFDSVVSKEEIFNYVWHDAKCTSRSNVSVLIYDLRLLLAKQKVEIINVRGVGYIMGRRIRRFS